MHMRDKVPLRLSSVAKTPQGTTLVPGISVINVDYTKGGRGEGGGE